MGTGFQEGALPCGVGGGTAETSGQLGNRAPCLAGPVLPGGLQSGNVGGQYAGPAQDCGVPSPLWGERDKWPH